MLNFDLARPTPRAFGKPRAGAHIIAVTGQLDSWLAKRADMVLDALSAALQNERGLTPRVGLRERP
jgi:D-arabinose 5-phosphate isomerase GutQ